MRARLVLVPIAVAAALLGGCTKPAGTTTTPATSAPVADNGVAALSADEILAKATTALAGAKSFRVKGEITESGTKSNIDMQFSGKDFKGNLSLEGLTIELTRIGDVLYLKASDAFWQTLIPANQQAALALLKDKHVKVDVTNASFGSLANAFDTNEILKPEGTVSKGEAKVVNGTPAIGVKGFSDSGVLYVATTGEAFPLRMESTGGAGGIDFSDFNATVSITAPPAGEVFDLKSLMGG